MHPASVREDTIVQQIDIAAPAAKIFAALTDPRELLAWWAAEGRFRATHVDTDPRPGGLWRMHVVSERAISPAVTIVHGVYRVVEPPHLLIYSWIREEDDRTETLVRWDLEESRGITTVRITHSGLVTEHLRNRNNGWPLVITLLKAFVEQPA